MQLLVSYLTVNECLWLKESSPLPFLHRAYSLLGHISLALCGDGDATCALRQPLNIAQH